MKDNEVLQWSQPIKILLRSRTAYFVGRYPFEILKKFFRYRVPGYFFTPMYKARVWDGYKVLLTRNCIAAGLFLAQLPAMKAAGLRFEIEDQRQRPFFKKVKESNRKFQNEALLAMQKKAKTGGIVIAATASGKTRLAGQLFKSLQGYAVFIVDELTLLEQTKDALEEALKEPVGYIGDMRFRPQRISVATVQTLHWHRKDPKFLPWARKLEVVVIDELHKALNMRQLQTVKTYFKVKAIFGLTATLELKKDIVFMKACSLCGPVIYRYPLERGTDEGLLSPGIVIAVDIVRNSVKGSDYQDDYKAMVVRSKKRNDVIEKIARCAYERNKYTCLLTEWVAHVNRLSKRLSDIQHYEVYGDKKVKYRIAAKQEFDAGRVKLIVANCVFERGVDIKRIDLIIDAASKPNRNSAQQKFGRGVRLFGSKLGLIYIDVGERSKPEQYNRFTSTTRRRRKALKELGVPVIPFDWDNNPEELLDKAELCLKKWVRKVEIRRAKLLRDSKRKS